MALHKKPQNPYVHLHYSNKQHLILAQFYINNASSIGSRHAKFQLHLLTQTTITVALVRLTQNVKCPVLNNRLVIPDSVHGLL